jgi:hypothetical protein
VENFEMITSIEWISVLKSKVSVQSDYAIAKLLGVSSATLSSYRTRKTFLDKIVCNRIAFLIEIDPKYLYVSTHYERAQSPEEMQVWFSLWQAIEGPQLEENIRENLDSKWLMPAVRMMRCMA